MTWRNCKASETLAAEVNTRWPNRDKTSDGTIGDAAHASRQSDHNPWVQDAKGVGVVRARDIDKDGIDADWLAEHLRLLGASGDPRLKNQGYVIWNRRITSPDFKRWNRYDGANPHTKHVHVSFSVDALGYDSAAKWGISPALSSGFDEAAWYRGELGSRTLRRGSQGSDVSALQTILRRRFPLYAKDLQVDGLFGPATETVIREFQKRSKLKADGIVGPKTFKALDI